MDRFRLGNFHPPPPPPPAASTTPAEPGAPAAGDPAPATPPPAPPGVRTRLLPAPPAPATDPWRRIGQGALATALGQGGCFGTAFALVNHLRQGANPAVMGLAGAVLPPLAGYLTAPAQRTLCQALDYQPTQPPTRTRWHEAVPSLVLYPIHAAYATARGLPRPAPGSPAAAGVTVLLSMTATGLAGALCEASAQVLGGQPEPLPDDAQVRRVGAGRALSLVPMGLANLRAAAYVTHLGQVPAGYRLRPLQVGVAGWACRKDLTPPGADAGSAP